MMRLARLSTFALTFALALGACSGDDDETDAGPPDMGPTDAVVPDTGTMDAAVQGPCDPVDGSGCIAPNTSCVLQVSGSLEGKGQCRELINTVGHEEVCNQSLQNCEAGYACIAFQGDDDPICRKVCRFLGGEGCEDLPDYSCRLRPGPTARYAFCAPEP